MTTLNLKISFIGDTGKFKKITIVDGSSGCSPFHVVNDKKFSAKGGRGTLGYVEPGEFRDVIMVPPLANITVSFCGWKKENWYKKAIEEIALILLD